MIMPTPNTFLNRRRIIPRLNLANRKSIILWDHFTGSNDDPIDGRTPDTKSNGNTWQLYDGAFTIQSNCLQGYYRAYIQPGTLNYKITTRLKQLTSTTHGPMINFRNTWSQYSGFQACANIQLDAVEIREVYSTVRASSAKTLSANTYYNLTLIANGTHLEFTVDDVTASYEGGSSRSGAYIGFHQGFAYSVVAEYFKVEEP